MNSVTKLTPNEMYNFNEKVVMVTGACGQLGRAMVSALIQSGAFVTALDLKHESLRETAKKLNWPDERIELVECDIQKKEQVKQAFVKAENRFQVINQLINNAGVSVFEPYLDRPESSIDLVMNVNLKGTLFCIQEFIRHHAKSSVGGEVVNIASHYGLISPDPRIYTDCERQNSEIYGATKAGIIQITKYMAVHAREFGVRVNAVSPGGVRNPDNPQGEDFQKNYGFRCPMERMAETHEIVGPVLFLLSPAASYINGQNIVVDGGMTCW